MKIKGIKFTNVLTHSSTLQSHTFDDDFIMNCSIFFALNEFDYRIFADAASANGKLKLFLRENAPFENFLILSHSHRASLSLSHSLIQSFLHIIEHEYQNSFRCAICEESSRGKKKVCEELNFNLCLLFLFIGLSSEWQFKKMEDKDENVIYYNKQGFEPSKILIEFSIFKTFCNY